MSLWKRRKVKETHVHVSPAFECPNLGCEWSTISQDFQQVLDEYLLHLMTHPMDDESVDDWGLPV